VNEFAEVEEIDRFNIRLRGCETAAASATAAKRPSERQVIAGTERMREVRCD
jgi:hypothetical protein